MPMTTSKRRVWLIATLTLTVPVVDGVVALTTNIASSTRFPGILGYIRIYPWPSLGLAIMVAATLALALWVLIDQSSNSGRQESLTPYDAAALRSRLINQVYKRWIVEILGDALTDSPWLSVPAVNTPNAVSHPSGETPSISDKSHRSFRVPYGAYSHHNGMLLILGARGAGKTVFLLRILRILVRNAERDSAAPVPVVFNLAAWNEKRGTLAFWMGEEVERYYGVSASVFQDWVAVGAVVPLFDRLDEIPQGSIDRHVEALNDFKRTAHLSGMVVCIRTDKYLQASARLELTGAVTLEQLPLADIDQLLQRPEYAALRRLAVTDDRFRTFMQNRLALTLSYRVQNDLDKDDMVRIWSRDSEPMPIVLDLYVHRLYQKYPTSKWADVKTSLWLDWLARYVTDHGIGILHPLWMQPDILGGRFYRWLMSIGSALAAMTLLLLLAAPIGLFLADVPSDWESNRLPNSLMLILFLSLIGIIGIFAGFDASIIPIARSRWVWPLSIRQFLSTIGLAVSVGICAGVVTAVVNGPAEEVPVGAIFAFGMAGTVIAFRGLRFARQDPDSPILQWEAGKVIKRALIDGAVAGAAGGTCFGIYVGFIATPLAGLLNILEVGVSAAIMIAALNTMRVAGKPLLQHACLLVILACRGRGPIRYHSFLAESANRHFLVGVDHSYTFSHSLLADYFMRQPVHGEYTELANESPALRQAE
jgi:hypothetical protein